MYVTPGSSILQASPAELHVEAQLDDTDNPEDWKPYAIHLTGSELSEGDIPRVEVSKSGNFYITINEKAIKNRKSPYWVRSITLKDTVKADGNLDVTFYVSYNPQRRKCELETDIITIKMASGMLCHPSLATPSSVVKFSKPCTKSVVPSDVSYKLRKYASASLTGSQLISKEYGVILLASWVIGVDTYIGRVDIPLNGIESIPEAILIVIISVSSSHLRL